MQKQDQQSGLSGISGRNCEMRMGRQAGPDPGPHSSLIEALLAKGGLIKIQEGW